MSATSIPELFDQPVPSAEFRAAPHRALLVDSQSRAAVLAREQRLAAIAHDIRTPLGIITLTSALLSRSDLPKAHAQAVRRIVDATEMIRNLVCDIVEEANPIGESRQLNLQAVTCRSLIEDVVRMMQPLADASRIRLIADAETMESLRLDPQQMLRVFFNLVGNAIQFSPAGSVVTIAARAAAGGVTLSVADNGRGIAEEDLEHLFDRHWRGKAHPDVKGTGLGLPIAKRIVEAHGGVIGVTSARGAGTTLAFTLPTGTGQVPAAGETAPPAHLSLATRRSVLADHQNVLAGGRIPGP